jgi:ribulose-5-phosphate 4-epimerase/fuculose-1-phosphate aldolase
MKYLLCHYIKECYNNKWIAPVDGNISYKPANANFFYITPTSLRKHEINNDDIVKMNINYNDKTIIKDMESNRTPSGEIDLHGKFMLDNNYYNKNVCIVHCHPPYMLAYIGIIKQNRELKTILNLFPELSIKVGNNVPYIEAKTPLLAEKTYEMMGENEIVALKQHGIVAICESFQRVMEIIETLEYYCKIALLE